MITGTKDATPAQRPPTKATPYQDELIIKKLSLYKRTAFRLNERLRLDERPGGLNERLRLNERPAALTKRVAR
jgi:hypothetical protein